MKEDIQVIIEEQTIVVEMPGETPGGSGGTSDHSLLTNRSLADQHPISAITGLTEDLASNLAAAKLIQIEFALSDNTSAITVGSKYKYAFKQACTITEIVATLGTAATGANVTVDIKRTASNTSIFSTKLTIDATEKTSRTADVPYVLASTPLTFANNEEIEILYDVVGLVEAGRIGILSLIGTK